MEKIYCFGVQVVTDPQCLTNEEDTPDNELLDEMLAGERPDLIFFLHQSLSDTWQEVYLLMMHLYNEECLLCLQYGRGA